MTTSKTPIRVIVAGALGRMGAEVVRAVLASKDCELVAAIDTAKEKEGIDIGNALNMEDLGVLVSSDFEGSVCAASQDIPKVDKTDTDGGVVLVDFTHPSVVFNHTRTAIAYGVNPVIGTTGLTSQQINELAEFANKAEVGSAIIPNFSVGMILLQQAASSAARFYEHAELTELHHNKKADAPSGTCIKTAELMEEQRESFNISGLEEIETLEGSRGGNRKSGLRIHSVRLPGLVAHQEVIFGANGESYKLSHNTIDRSAYMPGVLLSIRKVRFLKTLIYGLENIL